jgi:TolB-like protein/Flp pilus assembly protein TadD
MSNEPGQENFTDGMTDALITDLSKVSGLFIISRNSTFVYKGKPVKIAQVAEELGVRYVLEGSVQRAGDQVRVNAQLVDALSGAHTWADRYDGNITNIFAAQDDFVGKIVNALEVELTPGEKHEISSGKTEDINAKAAFDEGWSLYLRYSSKDNATAISALERAVEIDPSYGRAYAALSLAYLRIYDSIWFEEFGMSREQVWAKITDFLQLAEKYPTSLSHVARAMVETCLGSAQEARREAGRAVALDPNDPEAHIAMAFALTVSGEPAEALEFVTAAKRLNPNYPSHYVLAQAIALFTSNNLDEAVSVLEKGAKRNPEAISLLVPLSSILTQLGRRDEARQVLLKGWPGASQTEVDSLPGAIMLPYQWDHAHQRVASRKWLEFDGVVAENMMVPRQAARSIG